MGNRKKSLVIGKKEKGKRKEEKGKRKKERLDYVSCG
jgi:hypothetical protein